MGKLPDISTYHVWMYLPASEGLDWGVSWGYGMFILVALLEIVGAVCSIIGARKLAETVPQHHRDMMKGCSEWEWKTHLSLSAMVGFFAILLSIAVVTVDSFISQSNGRTLTATMFDLGYNGNITTISNFCSRGAADTTCGNSSCEGDLDSFCSLRTAAVTFCIMGSIFTLFHIMMILAICMDIPVPSCMEACTPSQAWVRAAISTALQAIAALFAVLLLPLWGGLKGVLPDLDPDGQWKYLPDTAGSGWRFDWGYVFTYPLALLAIASAVFGGIGAKVLRESAHPVLNPGENVHESLSGAAAPTPRAIGQPDEFQSADTVMHTQVGKKTVDQEKYTEYTDSTL